MDDVEVNEARPACAGVVYHIAHGSVAVGPEAREQVAGHAMGAAELFAGGAKHINRQRFVEQMRPEAVARQTILHHRIGPHGPRGISRIQPPED